MIDDDHTAIAVAKSFHELLEIGMTLAKRLPPPVIQLSGPMTTGGLGTLELNVQFMRTATQSLIDQGHAVFDILVFHDTIMRLLAMRDDPSYPYELMEIFFRGMFASGHIHAVYFLPGWETSVGSRWERDCVTQLGLAIVDLTLAVPLPAVAPHQITVPDPHIHRLS